MNLNLRTSGALSRAHFSLVQRVEAASSPDTIILREIPVIRDALRQPGLTSVSLRPFSQRGIY